MRLSLVIFSFLATSALGSAIALDNALPVARSDSLSLRSSKPSDCDKDDWGNAVEKDRKTTTIRASKSDTDDISAEFLAGLQKANNGGLLVLEKGKKYVIGKKLDLTFLNNIYVRLDGEILFTDDIAYWQKNAFYYAFQASVTFWVWGGKDIKIFGSGTINGNGQAWWNGFASHEILDSNNTYYRPILFTTDNATNIAVTGITQKNSPCWNNFFIRTNNVVFDHVFIDAVSNNASSLPKNTDGFDSLNVNGLTVTNTRVNNGDDCFSPKPNTTNILVQNLWCNGSHGVSMGSIGQYPGVKDIIENAWIENVTLINGQNGARLKAWAGPNVGYGYMNNITYKDIHIENTDSPLVLDQCYFNINQTTCAKYPSKVNITNINFINFTGSSSGKNKKVVGSLICSPGATCSGIHAQNINITSPAGSPTEILCENIQGGIGIPCTSSTNSTS